MHDLEYSQDLDLGCRSLFYQSLAYGLAALLTTVLAYDLLNLLAQDLAHGCQVSSPKILLRISCTDAKILLTDIKYQ